MTRNPIERTRIQIGEYECRIRPVMPKPETKFISEPPVGFETLSEGAIRNILQYADLPPDDPAQLKNLTPTQIYELARDKDKFGAGGSIASVIPDGGDAIRTALILRAKLIIEASKHSGFNIPGAQDRENLLSEIRQALHGPDKEPDDGFPF